MKKTIFVLVTFAFLIATSCQDKTSLAELDEMKAQVQLEEQNKIVAARWHNDLSLDRNWDAANEILAEGVILHLPGGNEITGREETLTLLQGSPPTPNMEINHYEIIAEGDYVLIRWDVAFDHTDEFLGIPASGNQISGIEGMDLFLIKDGMIQEFWQSYDQLGMMQKMGVIPVE